jgi:hypothetical protein
LNYAQACNKVSDYDPYRKLMSETRLRDEDTPVASGRLAAYAASDGKALVVLVK